MESVRQANFLIPQEVLDDLRRLVPRGEQSQVVTNALKLELKRRKLKATLKASFGAWGGHKNLRSARSFVRKLRRERSF
ncbi:MAG: hypothetical protein HYT76_06620 [Deltaproteobacteria bacterium]|nr:hypothetical protein [Deltaproteobacteria bacterium]